MTNTIVLVSRNQAALASPEFIIAMKREGVQGDPDPYDPNDMQKFVYYLTRAVLKYDHEAPGITPTQTTGVTGINTLLRAAAVTDRAAAAVLLAANTPLPGGDGTHTDPVGFDPNGG